MKKLLLFILLLTGIKDTPIQSAQLKSDHFAEKETLPKRVPGWHNRLTYE